MKHKKIIIPIVVVLVVLILGVVCTVLGLSQYGEVSVHDEGTVESLSETSWIDTIDNTTHTVTTYSLGSTATKVSSELSSDITLQHLYVDDIPIYEMYSTSTTGGCKLLIFLHGQGSRKEEFLEDMTNYAEAGYLCVCVDLVGYGERITSESIMSLESTTETGNDIDTLISYYTNISYANVDNFGIIGLSQGGSVAYWYLAYGYYTPSVMVVGSTTPDYNYYIDDSCIQNGKIVTSIWDDTQIDEYIKENNPINRLDRLSSIPIMSGNSLDDTVVSYKGSETFEKLLRDNGNTESVFYYFDGVGHNVSEDFIQKIMAYLNSKL